MALQSTFRHLLTELQKLRDALDALHLTINDKPLRDDAAMTNDLEDTLLDITGLLHESLRAAREGEKAVGQELDLSKARRALTESHEGFHRIAQRFSTDLGSYEKLRYLDRLGSERRGEWLAWTRSTKQGIELCREPLDAISQALAGCWQGIAEHPASTNVSVRATNIGQKIVTRDLSEREFLGDRAT